MSTTDPTRLPASVVEVRRGEPDDLEAVARLTLAAYEPFVLGPDDPYRDRLADAAARHREAELWVATLAGAVVGSVTGCPAGSPWREIARSGEDEFRMLAVDPARHGSGVGAALVDHLLTRAQRHGRAVAISSLPTMTSAHRLYRHLGFRRAPDRDWAPHPGTELWAFTADPADRLASTTGS